MKYNIEFINDVIFIKEQIKNLEDTVSLIENGVEIPGDWSGVVYTTIDDNWKQTTMKEMAAAGLKFDWSKA